MKKFLGTELENMPDDVIKSELLNKKVRVVLNEGSKDEILMEGYIDHFFGYSVDEDKRNSIAGVNLKTVEPVSFSEAMVIYVDE